MDEDEIFRLAKSMRGLDEGFIGVIPKNQIPDLTNTTTTKSFIVNTDKYGEPGTHWVGIYVSQDDSVVYFDSFGIDPNVDPYIINLIHECGKSSLYYSNRQIQSFNSSLCGLYTLYTLYLLTNEGLNLNQCLDIFDNTNLEVNDDMIRDVFKNIFILLKLDMI